MPISMLRLKKLNKFIKIIMNKQVPECFYRISVKALILDDKKRFLLSKEKNGKWELPGGGLIFGEKPQDCLKREIKEEMGIEVISIEDNPCYFLTSQKQDGCWIANIVYLTKVKNLNFTPSDECVEVRVFTKEKTLKENLFPSIEDFVVMYDEKNH